ncbi:rod shape-determining protein MreD [Patescibacteria group bacterium]|nr:rod shape-determining protein MreD [Patescibacteria group bacterium]
MKFFLLLILFFFVVSLQIAVLPRLEILGVVPNFILAATIVWAICEQEKKSSWLVLIPVFLFDAVAGRPFGLIILSMWLAFGFVRWLSRSLFKQSGFVSVLVLSVSGVLFYSLVFAGLAKLAEFSGLSSQTLFLADFYSYPNLLVAVLYNGLFCLLVFWPFKKLQRYFDKFSVQLQPIK